MIALSDDAGRHQPGGEHWIVFESADEWHHPKERWAPVDIAKIRRSCTVKNSVVITS
jgi:hypothetical protein